MRPGLLASLFVVLCGVIAGLCVWQLVPAPFRAGIPNLHQQDFRFVRNESSAFEVSDAKWFAVPWLYADFDLTMDVELGEGMTLDVLLRQVEPRVLGSELVPFHGRFTVLRLSTIGSGTPWLLRGEALFARHGRGAELAAGHTATVWVQARGRALRANVAGTWYPWVLADDVYGALTLVATGGKAVLQSLVITDRGQPDAWLWSGWLWASLGGLFGLVLLAVTSVYGDRAWVGIWFVGFAWLFQRQVEGLAPLALPPVPTMVAVLGVAAVSSLVLCRGLRGARYLLFLGVLWLVANGSPVSADPSDPRLDSTFGPAAGASLSEALAQRVRGPFEVHDVSPAERRVFLLGGQLLYNRGAPTEHLEPMLAGDLRTRLRAPVDVPCLPTQDGYSAQQWRLFEQFYSGYRPHVLVFGVPRDEAAPGADGRPRSSPDELLQTLRAARAFCRENNAQFVLLTEHGLPRDLYAAVQQVAADGVPLVDIAAGEAPAEISRRLADVVAPLLPKGTPR